MITAPDLVIPPMSIHDDRDTWREHAEADCGALRRVWHSLAELDYIAAKLREKLPNGATSRVVADTLNAATTDVRAAILGTRGTWTAGGERDAPLSGPGFPAGWPDPAARMRRADRHFRRESDAQTEAPATG